MKKQEQFAKMVKVTVELPVELVEGIEAMEKLKQLPKESLIRLWVEDALEREELRFERLLLFAEMTGELDAETAAAIAKLKVKYFDEGQDGERGLDPYMVKSQSNNHQYQATSGKYPLYLAK